MPVTPIVPAKEIVVVSETNGTTIKTLASKKMPVPDYPILWWTPPTSPPPATGSSSGQSLEKDASSAEQAFPFVLSDCGLEYTCTFSQNRSLVSSSSMILFEASKLDENDKPSMNRNDSQAWVLNTVTDRRPYSPEHTNFLSALPFTHAWSYSFQSDVVETLFEPSLALSNATPADKTAFLESVLAAPKMALSEKNRLRALAKENGGKASAVWIATLNEQTVDETTECKDAPSGRESYIRELLKMMDVDIYGGACMNNTVWPMHSDTQQPYTSQEIISDYKFVFALERVNCQDLVTSILADAFAVGAIPIVDGPKDYTRFSPTQNALIQINSFIAPELLAQEIDKLDKDDALYLERLQYKQMAEGKGEQEISPLFQETFGTTITTSGENPKLNSWEPNQHGAYCKICRLAHDIAEGTYDWTKRNAEAAAAAAVSGESTCEVEPRYLPGLPAQMKAYDDYLQQQNQKPENVPKTDSSNANTLDVKVSLDKPTLGEPNLTVGDLSSSNPADTWIQSGGLAGNMPSAVIHHAGEVTDPTPGTAALLLQQQQLAQRLEAAKNPPPFEMFYLLILILVLCVGVIALMLLTSKSARRFILWPWRHLFYKKVPKDDREAVSLERVMLRELGEDLLHE